MDRAPTRVMTIGCSCINRFQFDFFQRRHPGSEVHFVKSLFDWNIVSIVGTTTILQRALDGTLRDALADASLFHVDWEALLFHDEIPGFCVFHEEDIARTFDDPAQKDALTSKLLHLAAPLLNPSYPGRTHLIWSNIQPNLPSAVENVIPWETFQLTTERYQTLKALGQALFGEETGFSFHNIREDIAPELIGAKDVRLFDLPRGPDYEGSFELYDSLLAGIVSETHP